MKQAPGPHQNQNEQDIKYEKVHVCDIWQKEDTVFISCKIEVGKLVCLI